MKIATALLLFCGFYQTTLRGAEVDVKNDNIVVGNASFVEYDTTGNLLFIYGGMAGTCATADTQAANPVVCNSCNQPGGSLNACNQQSIYPALNMTVTFLASKAVTGVVQYFLSAVNAATPTFPGPVVASQAYAANAVVALPSIPWSKICEAAGLTDACNSGSGTAQLAFGIDSDANGSVDFAAETKKISIKVHVIADGDPSASNNYCAPGTVTTPGYCRVVFKSGDEKVYIEADAPNQAITGGADGTVGIDFDALAIFPIPVASASVGGAAITGFLPNQVAPIFKPLDATTTTILDEQVTGGLQNYQTYCFIYGNKNKAQNIYHFAAGSRATDASTMAVETCVAPSEVAGLLTDKHCFISTAAFGSDMAREVQTFREFRNRYLLTNSVGRRFVKAYYKFSPPLAEIISSSEILRSLTRTALYPILIFSSMALQYGILVSLLSFMVLLVLAFKIKSVVKQKRLLLFLFILILTPSLKAQLVPQTTVIQHPEAAEGLVRITKDGTYVYDIKRELRKESGRITVGHALQPEVSIDIEKRNPTTGAGTGDFVTKDFSDLYKETSSFIIGYDFDHYLWMGSKGKLGYQLGGALMYAQGHGIVEADLSDSREKFTFFTIPLFAGLAYRLEWKDRQLLVPYGAGGGTYTALIEKREDKSTPLYTGAPGFYAAGGVLLNITALDEDAGFELDSQYGISNMWVSLEYKVIEVNADSFKFANNYVNLGVAFDF